MKELQEICLFLLVALVFSISLRAQNRFEGYNIIVEAPETQAELACATRYAANNTKVTIVDLEPKTPMRLQSCRGNFAPVQRINAVSASVTVADNSDSKWCFIGEDKLYRVTFPGDKYLPKISYNWIATPAARELGFYNVRDFGAQGDGRTDDTVAIKSAVAYVATRNGGKLQFPDGDYLVGNAPEYPDFKGITLPSGIIIEGTGSNNTLAPTNNVIKRNASRINLRGQNRAIFRIGECTQRVTVRDLELFAQSNEKTYGVEAVGAFGTSQDFFFDRVAFSEFARGIYGHALPVNNSVWQFDFIKVSGCRFNLNRDAGIWLDFWNSNWAVKGTFFVTPVKTPTAAANGIYVAKNGNLLVEDTFAGTPGGGGGDFIYAIELAQLTIIGSQSEGMSRSLVFGEGTVAAGNIGYTGNLGFTITLLNNVFGDSIEIKARKTVVSVGNTYNTKTFKLLDADARVYSTGDRFCLDGYTAGCDVPNAKSAGFAGGRVIFSTGQPAEGRVPGRPTVFGHDVQFNAPIQLPNLEFKAFPTQTIGNGSFIYCTDCRRNTAPCQTGGNGAPAIFVGNRWECL